MNNKKKAAVLLAEGFEEGESLFLIDILRRCGIQADSISIKEPIVSGCHQIKAIADYTINEVNHDDYDMVVIPGGMPGAANLRDSADVIDWVRDFNEKGKYIAAICAGPMVLKEAGVSEGRKLTSYPADKYREMFADAEYVDDNAQMDMMVVQDGNLITSRGPATTLPFAFYLADVLGGSVDAVKNGILYNDLIKVIRD